MPGLSYYRRIASAYLLGGNSHLSFWHEIPEENRNATAGELGEYYMTFADKGDYPGPFDAAGVPLLDYRGAIGRQYNPIAIAQYGLANYNAFKRTSDSSSRTKFFLAAEWLRLNLEKNPEGISVWNHHFDWEYRDTLRQPWYSGLAQGQGISVLVRAHKESGEQRYLEAARSAFASFAKSTVEGGVVFIDGNGDVWFEEYIISPPTHILNGFMWAAWGVHDYFLATRDHTAEDLFRHGVKTLLRNLDRYDLGFWSRYELSDTRLPMIASRFYHQLHIVQLRVMHRLTGQEKFARVAERWENYGRSRTKRTRALCYKSAFKLCYY